MRVKAPVKARDFTMMFWFPAPRKTPMPWTATLPCFPAWEFPRTGGSDGFPTFPAPPRKSAPNGALVPRAGLFSFR